MTKISLDVHVHLVSPRHIAGMEGVSWDAAARSLSVDGKLVGPKGLFEPLRLLEWMDRQEIEKSWISVPPSVYRQQLDEAASGDWTARLNEGLADIAAIRPDRLEPLYHLPVEHPALAARMAQALKVSRYALSAGGETDLVFSDSRLDPLWAVFDAADAFIFLHPGRCCDGRLSRFYLENLLGNPHETSVTVAHLIFGGVLERYPNIRFCLAHGGGTTPMMAGRWQHGFDIALPELADVQGEGPLALLGRFYADCLTHSEQALACSAAIFGKDQILFGSDWPFLMGIAEPHRYLGQQHSLADHIRNAVPR
jgi:aminocarboxymuconate-semialdehyde decarboxylase